MKMENRFTVGIPLEEVWKVLLDLEKVAPCLPGASIDEAEDGEYRGTMTVKLGPVTVKYKGTVHYEETDEENHRAVLRASGRDARGQGTASATIVSTLREGSGNTEVHVETDMKLTGRAAQFGRGIQQDVAAKLLTQFAECLEQKLSAGREQVTADTNGAAGQQEALSENGAEEEKPTVRKINQPEPEPLDLGEMGREAVVKRVRPVLIGLAVLAVLIWLLRRR